MEQLRYPIGRFIYEGMSPQQQREWMNDIEQFPEHLHTAIAGLSSEQLNLPYRVEGWSVRQVVHHLADSSMNGLIRFKLALTEDNPTIKPFKEEKWADLADTVDVGVDISLSIAEGVHHRWVVLLRSLERDQFDRQFYHPEIGRQITLAYYLGYAAWHGKHHLAQINDLRLREHW